MLEWAVIISTTKGGFMPNRQQHSYFGALAGIAVATNGLCSGKSGWFAAGAVTRSLTGSWLPDRVDPPVFPGHRGFGHSLLFIGIVVLLLYWI